MRASEILTSQWHWDRAEVIPAGGTGSGYSSSNGIRGGNATSLSDMLFAENLGGTPLYLRRKAIRNKRFYELMCRSMQMAAYIGLSENLTKEKLDEIVDQIRDTIESKKPPEVILVTTGTDAMEQIARYIDKKLGGLIRSKGIRVVLTGANRDLSKENTDIWENLEFAFESGFRKDIVPGIYVAFHRRLVPVDLVVKEPFNGIEMNYISRRSPRYWLASMRQTARDALVISRLWYKLGLNAEASRRVVDYPVNVIRENHDKLREKIKREYIMAVLLILYHSSTANTLDECPEMSVANLAKDLRRQGINVLAVTENAEPVNLSAEAYETSVKLAEAGVKGLGNMSCRVAFAKMAMSASSGTNEEFISKMSTSYVGEAILT